MRLTPEEVALIANALREKAGGDRDAVRLAPIPPRTRDALVRSAALADVLAEKLEIAHAIEVLP